MLHHKCTPSSDLYCVYFIAAAVAIVVVGFDVDDGDDDEKEEEDGDGGDDDDGGDVDVDDDDAISLLFYLFAFNVYHKFMIISKIWGQLDKKLQSGLGPGLHTCTTWSNSRYDIRFQREEKTTIETLSKRTVSHYAYVKIENMASSSGKTPNFGLPLEELSNQFLICPLCLEQYKSPKVLPCQHTFCLECIRAYIAARGLDCTLPCPLCKEMARIPDNDPSKLKNNFMIVSLLQFVEATATKAESPTDRNLGSLFGSDEASEDGCGACGEITSMTNFCQVCHLWLCNICTKAHTRLPATATHELLTSNQMDACCKAMVGKGEKALGEIQTSNSELYEALVAQQSKLPENVRLVKERVEAAAALAVRVINEKTAELTQQAEQFLLEQSDILKQRGREVLKAKGELDGIEDLLQSVKVSEDGYKNQKAIKKVEEYLNRSQYFPSPYEAGISALSLSFTAFGNNLADLKNLEIGQMRVVSEKLKKVFLVDRTLTIRKNSALVERDYISALAINKFADKFVVANNQNVMIIKPESVIPKRFLSLDSERNITKPWGIAYSEEDRRIFISQSGPFEGDGSIMSYTHDGFFHSQIASGLTLPRGIAVHKSYIFVCDQIDKCVYILTTAGKVVRVLKKTPDGKTIFNGPMFISVGKSGIFAVSDNCTSVKIFDKDCNLKYTYISSLPESQFWDVHVTLTNAVVVCDWKHGLHKISPTFDNNGMISVDGTDLREPSAITALEHGSSLYVGTCGGDIFSAI
ncbi:tripartite motif-containing protein 2 [Elysia marginata]|uniref:Tripartite motif-containing protein 2 n=1 Tax=Elysia marginata TaxID=1093978 RepID=A0AAV4JGC8_9GAST|nr:tripartite motif-containing protein 2 [Elysia marginata]